MNLTSIVWLDLETTGLHPSKDVILEIGIIITDFQLNELTRGQWIVQQSDGTLSIMNSMVRTMHTNNNLINEVKELGIPLEDIEQKIIKFLSPYIVKDTKFIMGGNSIGFDKNFIKYHLPSLAELFHYRIIDMSSISIVAEHWCPIKFDKVQKQIKGTKDLKRSRDSNEPKISGNLEESKIIDEHRAIPDIEKCLKYSRLYKDIIFT
jgi:oligoribonuclease